MAVGEYMSYPDDYKKRACELKDRGELTNEKIFKQLRKEYPEVTTPTRQRQLLYEWREANQLSKEMDRLKERLIDLHSKKKIPDEVQKVSSSWPVGPVNITVSPCSIATASFSVASGWKI